MLTEFGKILIFMIIAVLFVAGGLLMNAIIRPKRPTREKGMTYECGEEPVGEAWVKFNPRFFVVALIFVLFDVEIVFLFPWATVFQKLGMPAFYEMLVFLGILIAGFAYVWAKGDLDWERPEPVLPTMSTLISHDKPRLKPAATAMEAAPVPEPVQ